MPLPPNITTKGLSCSGGIARSPTGLAAFLGRVTGATLIRNAIHRFEDGQRLQAYKQERAALDARQKDEARGTLRCEAVEREPSRIAHSLGSV